MTRVIYFFSVVFFCIQLPLTVWAVEDKTTRVAERVSATAKMDVDDSVFSKRRTPSPSREWQEGRPEPY